VSRTMWEASQYSHARNGWRFGHDCGQPVFTDAAGSSSMGPKWAFGGGQKSMAGSRGFFAFTVLAILIPALPSGGQTVSMNPSKLSFSYTPGGPNPPSQG